MLTTSGGLAVWLHLQFYPSPEAMHTRLGSIPSRAAHVLPDFVHMYVPLTLCPSLSLSRAPALSWSFPVPLSSPLLAPAFSEAFLFRQRPLLLSIVTICCVQRE